jgi:collagenase-like PrtC family protease
MTSQAGVSKMVDASNPPLKFSVPYNGDPATLEEIIKLREPSGNVIDEIYLSGPQVYSGSGRAAPKIGLEEFAALVDKIRQHDIRPNLVLNSTCEGYEWYSQETMLATMKLLQTMYEEHGLASVTIANPLYIKAVKQRFPNIQVSASVLSEINCVQRAQHYINAGADIISPDVNINRNLGLLKQIKDVTGIRLKLLVNEGCLFKCPFRMFHFNAMSHVSKKVDSNVDASFGDFFGACTEVVTQDASEIFKSCWIRPEDTRKYGEITDYFKIVGRGQRKSMISRTIKAYLQEKWDGDLLDILTGACRKFSYHHGGYVSNQALEACSFFKMVTSCDKDCVNCSYCANLADTIIYSGIHTPEKAADLGL